VLNHKILYFTSVEIHTLSLFVFADILQNISKGRARKRDGRERTKKTLVTVIIDHRKRK
jgi:hypothetical protein